MDSRNASAVAAFICTSQAPVLNLPSNSKSNKVNNFIEACSNNYFLVNLFVGTKSNSLKPSCSNYPKTIFSGRHLKVRSGKNSNCTVSYIRNMNIQRTTISRQEVCLAIDRQQIFIIFVSSNLPNTYSKM